MAAVAATTYKISPQELATAIQQLGDFVEIPSVSNPASPDYNMESLQRAANFAAQRLKGLGFIVRQVCIDGSAPFVLAEKIVDATKPTLLLYAHYDVQPVDREKWTVDGRLTDPFVMQERDGRLYGRGASDDKGGIIGIITALGAYQRAYGVLPCNIKTLFEGEEEYGSSHMPGLLRHERDALRADALVILDGSNLNVTTGTLTNSTRGIVNIHLNVHPVEGGAAAAPRLSIVEGSWGKPNGGNSIQEVASCKIRVRLNEGEAFQQVLDTLAQHLNTLEAARGFNLTVAATDVVGTFKLEVRSMEKPIHSGVGCLAPDPSLALAELLVALQDPILNEGLAPSASLALAKLMVSLKEPRTIAGFMEDSAPIHPTERALLRGSSQTTEQYAADHSLIAGARLRGHPDLSVYERIAEEPSISFVNGVLNRDGVASVQIGVRLTAGQSPERISRLLAGYLEAQSAAQGVTVTMKQAEGCYAWKGDLSRPLSQKYLKALGENFPETHVQPCGGALPLLREFEEVFPEMEMLVPGVEDPKCSAHSHLESQDKGLFERAINSLISFFHKVGRD